MSTSATPPASSTISKDEIEIKIVSHSNLFYWWPVWAVGFLMGAITMMHGTLLAVVPEKTVAVKEIGKELPAEKIEAELVGTTSAATDKEVKGRSALLFPKEFKD